MNSKEIYACKVHIDDAMDDLINYEETFPIMEKAKDMKCSYCSENEVKNNKFNIKPLKRRRNI